MYTTLWSWLTGIEAYVLASGSASFIAALVVVTTCCLWWKCSRRKDKAISAEVSRTQQESEEDKGDGQVVPIHGRIRKRDIMQHYGRRIIKKASLELRHLRKRPASIAKRFLQRPVIPERKLYKEPPPAFLEADYLEGDRQIPADVLFLLKSVRAFGHFEKPLFMALCKNVETKFVPAGALLFRPGQVDNSIYVVKSGRLSVFIVEQDGSELPLKTVGTGESVHSMLSILDSVVESPRLFKSVAARAVRDTYVLQVQAEAFCNFFKDNPDSLLRMVQIIMLRLQRVTFMALNHVLGLGHELFNQKPIYNFDTRDCNIMKLKVPAVKFAIGNESRKSQHHHVTNADTDTEGEEPQGEGLHRRAQHKGEASSRHEEATNTSSSDQAHPTGLDSSEFVVTKAQVNLHPTSLQSPEFENVIEQARVDWNEFSSNAAGLSEARGAQQSAHYSHFMSLQGSDVLLAATKDLVMIFRLKDDTPLKGRIQLIEVAADSVLGSEGDLESCIYFVVTGRLKVFRHTGQDPKHQDLLYVACPGEFCGVLSALTGEPSFITIIAANDSHLVAITKANLYCIMAECPQAVCGLAFDLVQRLSPIVRQLDFALDWMELEAGRALYKQGDDAHTAYIILHGRVRAVLTKAGGKKELVDEYGRGEQIGVVEVLSNAPYATTVHAVRDTELACLPSGLLNTVKLKQPQVVSRLILMLGERLLGSYSRLSGGDTTSVPFALNERKKHMASNLSTVAVVPMTPDVPLAHFTRDLCRAVKNIAPSLRLTSGLVSKELGDTALESVHEYRLRTWLSHHEDTHRIVIYQADALLSPWTVRCIGQADCILLLGLAEKGPSESMGQVVKQVEAISARVQKELVLLHREDVKHPTGTVRWLNALGWVSSYFHVRCPNSFFVQKTNKQGSTLTLDKHSDIARLARRITGTSVGMALGGGSARGLSHVGTIKAFIEAGIPIDMVGSTSIGAFIGALYCEERNAERVELRAREWACRMSSFWDKLMDLTYPHTAMFTGRAFNNLLKQVFGEKQIEDLWIPYFCVSTDITDSKMRVHNSGSLWHYVRASMSLSGYLPPLCDPVDGHLLLDGGYVNNLPADLVAAMGAESVIAVDVGAEDNNDISNYGDHISGWWLLWNKFNPFSSQKLRVPNITEIQSRLAYVSCMRQLEAVKSDPMYEYIRPPIDHIMTLQFGRFDEIVPLGHKHCKLLISGWHKNQRLCHLVEPMSCIKEERDKKPYKQESIASSASFNDLAVLAAQIPMRPLIAITPDEDEEMVSTGYWSNPEDATYKMEDVYEVSPAEAETKAGSDSELQ